ncbi:MAG: hypothetical protein RIT45_829, partial [Pseudomonadota bacterium]
MSRSPVRLPTAVLVGFGILCLHGCIGRPGGADHRDAEGSAGLGRLYEEEGFAYRDGSKLT